MSSVPSIAALARGEITPLEAAEACLATIDDAVGAFAHLDADGARRAARARTDELARGARRSALHGVPIAVKDNIDVRGLPTGAGSALLATTAATRDAPVVARLRAAGVVVLGKTRLPEGAFGTFTPGTRHPRDPTRIAGGSSGGSAAAVAAGECLAALGTDTSGSIRIPAALCGVAGLLPGPGTVPLGGIRPVSSSLDRCGPITRTAEDLRMVWSVLAEPTGPSAPASLRIGRVPPELLGDVDDDVAAAVERVASAVDAVVVTPPDAAAWMPHRRVLLIAELLAVHRDAGRYPQRRAEYGPQLRAVLDAAAELTPDDVAAARRALDPLVVSFTACLDGLDALMLPTTPTTAPPVPVAGTPELPSGQTPQDRALARLCGPVNLCPLAAVTVPCGVDAAGLPIGVQLIARDEATALAAACHVEREVPVA